MPTTFHHSSSWAPFQCPKRHLAIRSREVSKPRDLYLELSHRPEIGQAPRQHCIWRACQISKRCDNLNSQSRGLEYTRDLTIRPSYQILRRGPAVNITQPQVHCTSRPPRPRWAHDICWAHRMNSRGVVICRWCFYSFSQTILQAKGKNAHQGRSDNTRPQRTSMMSRWKSGYIFRRSEKCTLLCRL